jgi:hypothetical protein
MQRRPFTLLPFIAIVWIMTWPQEARAIPAFARSHQVPCTLCHDGFPKLNHFGVAFMMRGYRMPGEEGKFLWDQPIPLSGRLNLSYQYLSQDWDPESNTGLAGLPTPNDVRSSSLALDSWQLLAGGTLMPKVSFFGHIVGLVERSGPDTGDAIDPSVIEQTSISPLHTVGLPVSQSSAIEEDTLRTDIQTETFLVQVNDLLPEGHLNLRMGKYHVDNHFLSTPHRLTQAIYFVQIQNILGPTLEPVSVGAELNGSFPFGLHYFTGVRNYGPAYDSKEDREQRVGAYYGLVNYTPLPHQTVSVMVTRDRKGDANVNQDDTTLGYGASLDLHLNDLNIIPGLFRYEEGEDIHAGQTLVVTSGTLEAMVPIRPNLLATARYDVYNRTLEDDPFDRSAEQYVLSLAWYPSPPVRWVLEYGLTSGQNLMLVNLSEGPLFVPTVEETDLTQTVIALLFEVNF